MSKVSVIMPSLNMVDYIEESVTSVLSQTLTDIEIICVDAGSDDGTIEILDRLAAKDSRMKVIKADKKSYGYQMNLGIEMARGEYIGIVETDDYIDPGMYEKLYNAAIENDADIVKSDYDMFVEDEDGERLFAAYPLGRFCGVEYGRVYSSRDYISGKPELEIYIWNAIYRRSFLTARNVRFNCTPGASFQDFSFRYQTCYFADRILAVKGTYYHYRRDNAAASTYNPRTVEYNLRESEYIVNMLEGMQDPELWAALSREIVKFASWPYLELLKWSVPADTTKEAYERFRHMLKKMLDKGYLKKEGMNLFLWFDANLMLEGIDHYMAYAKVWSGINAEKELEIVDAFRNAEDLIIFGAGFMGNAVYVFLKNNGLNNLRMFCDNNKEKQGTKKYKLMISSPEGALKAFPDATFILAVPNKENDLRAQLLELGVKEKKMLSYQLPIDPAFSTNCLAKKENKNE